MNCRTSLVKIFGDTEKETGYFKGGVLGEAILGWLADNSMHTLPCVTQLILNRPHTNG